MTAVIWSSLPMIYSSLRTHRVFLLFIYIPFLKASGVAYISSSGSKKRGGEAIGVFGTSVFQWVQKTAGIWGVYIKVTTPPHPCLWTWAFISCFLTANFWGNLGCVAQQRFWLLSKRNTLFTGICANSTTALWECLFLQVDWGGWETNFAHLS